MKNRRAKNESVTRILGGLDEEAYEGSYFAFNDQSLTFTVIPEPATMGLILGGLALTMAVRRRRG